MKKKSIILSSLKYVALFIITLNVNSACMFWIHQPKIPTKAKIQFKKVND